MQTFAGRKSRLSASPPNRPGFGTTNQRMKTTTFAERTMAESRPWQLLMFDKTLKKKQRFHALTRLLGAIRPNERCLLVTCGDNNGAMNYHLREIGGQWAWADSESRSIAEMSALLGSTSRTSSRASAAPLSLTKRWGKR